MADVISITRNVAASGGLAERHSLAEVAVHLHPIDDVAIAKVPLSAGTILPDAPWGEVTVVRLIPTGHKVALRAVAQGDAVRRYGHTIGFATAPIAPGDHVHSHNLGVGAMTMDYAFGVDVLPVDYVPAAQRRTFMGFARPNGAVGTRNYIAIISSVNCSASVCRAIADHFRAPAALSAYPTVDGVIALTHKGGCGARYGSAEMGQLQRTLAAFARHSNVGGCIVVGLGCEINQINDMFQNEGLALDGQGAIPRLVIQEEGGYHKTVASGIAAVTAMLPRVASAQRTPQSAEHLMVALQCGGSDGWSGVTANPAVGRAADAIVRQGGTVVLGETTEVYGAEYMLTRRAVSREVGEKLIERIDWWEHYTAIQGAEIDNNPSPGNKLGGLTTIFEKSLGAVAKSGSTPLTEVVDYARPVTQKGFVHMDTPGYDPVSVTGQVAGGCNVILFTTGRGSIFGFKPVPSIKIATNPALYAKMIDDMDISAGRALDGATLDEIGGEIFEMVLAVASGQQPKSEQNGVGEEEFNPWVIGAVL